MNAFVKQLAALSVLWSMCELLLPDGQSHRAVRLMVSVLVTTALLAGAGRMMQQQLPALAALSPGVQTAAAQSYAEIALRSAANQVQGYCVRLAARAGYQAQAQVFLRPDGAIDHIALALKAGQAAPLVDSARLLDTLAGQLHLQREQLIEAAP